MDVNGMDPALSEETFPDTLLFDPLHILIV
jgi:hypothetical protein